MKSTVQHRHVAAALFLGVAVVFSVYISRSYAQVSVQDRPLVSLTGKRAPSDRERVVNSTASAAGRFSAAASTNARLRGTLAWSFGKPQTGWNIYVPLIAHTIGADDAASPDSAEFAAAVAKWQAKHSLPPTGVVDADTLGAFVKFWQGQRKHGSAGDSSIVAVPVSDFWDPNRSPELLKVEQETYAAYKRMIAAAAKDLGGQLKLTKSGELAPEEKFLRIVSAYRSPEYQEQLRKKEPGAGRIALAKTSVHFTGRALDIYVGGEPTITKDLNRMIQVQTPVYKWLVKNAHRFGFYPYFYEPWHWEYAPGR